MPLLTTAPRGTQDVLPQNSYKWQFIEKTALDTARLFGFKEIRFPTFEHTELFNRSVGDTTDVVQKEMYTFEDKGNRSITLRPEGTAGTLRAVLQNGLLNDALPQKLCYLVSCFRYEKPQAGRLREFHQFGVEMLGSQSPSADVEVILLAKSIFDTLKIQNIDLHINSIGCPKCRSEYHKALISYFNSYKDQLCETCQSRLEKNPMRILDCKSPVCSKIAAGAPVVLDYLCEDCQTHFDKVQSLLKACGVSFSIDPHIVRGLDYYTKTVFEFVSQNIGAQGTVCGGGRYDGLIETLGGPSTPALGFGMGLERLLLLLEQTPEAYPPEKRCDLYIAPLGEEATAKAAQLAVGLRQEGFRCEYDLMGKSAKAQMKYANKLGAHFTLVLGDNELQTGKAALKNMDTGEAREVDLETGVLSALYDEGIAQTIHNITQDIEHLMKEER